MPLPPAVYGFLAIKAFQIIEKMVYNYGKASGLVIYPKLNTEQQEYMTKLIERVEDGSSSSMVDGKLADCTCDSRCTGSGHRCDSE